MKYLLYLCTIFLIACQDTRIKSPTANDIQGRWETLSVMQFLPYGLLEINGKGEGVLIAVNEETSAELVKFHSFKSLDREFQVVLHFLEDGELDEGTLITGSLDRGQLCFNIPEEEKAESDIEQYWVCFTKSEKVDGFRKRALEHLKEIEENA